MSRIATRSLPLIVAGGLLTAPLLAQGPPADPGLQRAGALMNSGKFDEAIAELEAVLERDPDEHWAWYQIGLAHHFAGRLDEALIGHRNALVGAAPLGRLRSGASYNIACVHARQGRTDVALQWLHRARNAGWKDAAHASKDTDLASLGEDSRFRAFVGSPAIAKEASAAVTSLTGELVGGTGGVAVAPDGTLFVADFGANVWRFAPDGERTLLAKGFTKAAGNAVASNGDLVQVDFEGKTVSRITMEGEVQDLGLQGLLGPVGVVVEPDGALFLVDYRLREVLRYEADGTRHVLARGGQLKGPNGITRAANGDLFVVNHSDGAVLRLTQGEDGWAISFVADLPGGGNGHIVARDGVLYVTSRLGNRVFRVTHDGLVTQVAGDGSRGVLDGDGSNARLAHPNGIAMSADGKALFTNDQATGGRFVVRKIALK